MRGSARIAPDPNITPEQARDVRTRAWKFVFDCHAKRNATSAIRVTSVNSDDDLQLTKREEADMT